MRLTGRAISTPSVVIHDLNVRRADVGPYEADAPLFVDADAVLTLAVVFQPLQVIPRRRLQESQCLRGVKLGELALGDLGQSLEAARAPTLVQRQSVLHLNDWIMRAVYYVPRKMAR